MNFRAYNLIYLQALRLLCCALMLCIGGQYCYAQKFRHIDELGLPLIRNYGPKEYQSDPQVLSICQDKRGMIYGTFATMVMEYDGVRWKRVPDIEFKEVRVLAYDAKTDFLYVGGNGTFGYLTPVVEGKRRFIDLTAKIPSNFPKMNEIWSIGITESGVYVFSDEALLRWHSGQFTQVKPKAYRLFMGFQVGQHYYINDRAGNIFQVIGQELKLVHHSDKLKSDGIFAMVPFRSPKGIKSLPAQILCATRNNGLMILQMDSLFTFENSAKALFAQGRVYVAIRLQNGHIAIGTLGNGVIILTAEGKLVHHLTKATGLTDDFIVSLFEDKEGLLWVGTSNGLSKIAANSPITVFDSRLNYRGSDFTITRHNGQLQVGGLAGLGTLVPQEHQAQVVPNKAFVSECNQFQKIDGQLWIATNQGIFILKDNHTVVHHFDSRCKALLHSNVKPDRVFIASRYGLTIQQKNKAGQWLNEKRLPFKDLNIYGLEEDEGGNLWIAAVNRGLMRLSYKSGQLDTQLVYYDSTRGIDFTMLNESIFTHEGKLHVCSPKGLLVYDAAKEVFRPVTIIGLSAQWGISYATTAGGKNLWCQAYHVKEKRLFHSLYLQYQSDGSYVASRRSFAPLSGLEYMYSFYSDSNQVTWANSNELLIRHDGNVPLRLPPFLTVMRSVQVLNLERSRNTTNQAATGTSENDLSLAGGWSLPYDAKHVIRFQFAGLSYHVPERNVFRYRLLGLNEEWSSWRSTSQLEYNSLWEGDYVLEVESRNVYNVIGSRIQLPFRIAPPWFRTYWAYLGYLTIFGLIVWGYAHFRGRQLVKANQILTLKVQERTQEIALQNRALAASNTEIQSKNTQLAQAFEELNANMEQIRDQNDIIFKKNLNIEDSIRYAYQIQQAILPEAAKMSSAFAQQFVYYRPKDIVSGDFYWLTIRDEVVYFALADCTGHGVPGAFMSVLGSNALDHAVLDLQLSDPDAVLFQIDRQIVSYLHQDAESTSKDGMDIAFCSWNPATRELRYAGAGRPIYLLQQGNLQIIKADKYPIGGGQHNGKQFTQHRFELDAGDRFYLFSDGITDQFGGPNRAKFTPKRLQQFILNHQELSMEAQGNAFHTHFKEWMGFNVQIDDLSFWGIEF